MVAMLLGIGIFGLLGLSVLCPLLAWPGYFFRVTKAKVKDQRPDNSPSPFSAVDILIPAHNEAGQIGATLASLQRSIQFLKLNPPVQPLPNISLQVGADGCTDETAQIARSFPIAQVTEFPEKASKWSTIKALLAQSTADWVILVDVGTLWPENFLAEIMARMANERRVIAVAPSYRPMGAGWLPRMIWRMETLFKRIEASCGGPVSLHGATVAYQTASLKKVLAHLGNRLWLNDDVVIPLILRALHPEGIILYPVGQVQDAGAQNNRLDLGRRKRMLLGNLQWVKTLLPDCFRRNPVVGMVATRRLFRILWAYWFICITAALMMSFHQAILPVMAILALLLIVSGNFRQLAGAAFVSLQTPFRLASSEAAAGGSWE